MKKKIMAIILSVLCLTMLLPVTAFAENSHTLGFADPTSGELSLKPGMENTKTVEFTVSPQLEEGQWVAIYSNGAAAIAQAYQVGGTKNKYKIYGFGNGSTTIQFAVVNGGSHMLSDIVTLQVTVSDKESYTVTFDTDGGTPTSIPSQTVEEDGKAVKPEDPTKEGYVFDGWINEATGETWNFEENLITDDLTLVAVWKETYTVKFNPNGGTPTSIPSQTVEKHGKVVKPEDPTKEGYVFSGWYPDFGGAPWNFEENLITDDLTLVAVWKEVPNTGDANNIWLYVLAGVLALGAMGTVVLKKRTDI